MQAEAQLQIVATADNEDWSKALVSAGLCFTIMPLSPQEDIPGVRCVALAQLLGLPSYKRELGLAFNAQATALAQAFNV